MKSLLRLTPTTHNKGQHVAATYLQERPLTFVSHSEKDSKPKTFPRVIQPMCQ